MPDTISTIPPQTETALIGALKAAAFEFFMQMKPTLVDLIKQHSPEPVIDTQALTDQISEQIRNQVRAIDLAPKIRAIVDDYDFSDLINDALKSARSDSAFDADVEEVIDNYDFDYKLETALRDYDLSSDIEDALDSRQCGDKVKKLARDAVLESPLLAEQLDAAVQRYFEGSSFYLNKAA